MVRPITEAEYKLAGGEPVTNMLAAFGAAQGLLTHLRYNGLNMGAKNLVPTPFAKLTLPLFVIGGTAVGATIGFQFFGDAQLRRLRVSHETDRANRVEARNYVPKERI